MDPAERQFHPLRRGVSRCNSCSSTRGLFHSTSAGLALFLASGKGVASRLVGGPASYFTRYSTRVVLAHWNERRETTLEAMTLDPGARVVDAGGLEWHIAWNAGHPETRAAVARSGDAAVTFVFSPPLPDLAALRPGIRVEGRFVINVNDVPGVVAGE